MKAEYSIISNAKKSDCIELLKKHHYLTGVSKGFKSGYNFILIKDGVVVGVCIFTGFPVPELVKGMYGLERNDQKGFFELSRLCLDPKDQSSEHNLASWFVSRCVKKLRKSTNVRSILSYADDDHHKGIVYRACNFKYYGLTSKKKDFWILHADGKSIKQSRGKTKGIKGEWRDRSRKHRFVMCFDLSLKIIWKLI